MTALRLLQSRAATGREAWDASRDEAHRGAVRDLLALRRAKAVAGPRTGNESADNLGRSQTTPEARRAPRAVNDSATLARKRPADERGSAWGLAGRVVELREQRAPRTEVTDRFQELWLTTHASALARLEKLTEEGANIRRRAWAFRDAVRAVHPNPRASACGFGRIGEVGVVERTEANGGGFTLASVETCSSAADCPVCALIIKGKRAAEIVQGVELHREKFGGASLTLGTFTIRHHQGDKLSTMLDGFQRAWNRFFTRIPTIDKILRKLARARGQEPPAPLLERMGYQGGVYGLEVTHGTNGWHPHRHAIMAFDHEIGDDERRDFQRAAAVWWARCVATEMGKKYVPNIERGFRCDALHRTNYIAKLGLEVSDVGAKRARGNNRNHWAIYEDAARGCSASLELAGDYSLSLKGKKLVQFSDRLRKLWKSWGWKHEEEDSADETSGARLRLEVPGTAWRFLRESGAIVDALEMPTVEEMCGAMKAIVPPGAWGPDWHGWGDGERSREECRDPPIIEGRATKRQRIREGWRTWKAAMDELALQQKPKDEPVKTDNERPAEDAKQVKHLACPAVQMDWCF